jgi:uncharacterized protein YpmB
MNIEIFKDTNGRKRFALIAGIAVIAIIIIAGAYLMFFRNSSGVNSDSSKQSLTKVLVQQDIIRLQNYPYEKKPMLTFQQTLKEDGES